MYMCFASPSSSLIALTTKSRYLSPAARPSMGLSFSMHFSTEPDLTRKSFGMFIFSPTRLPSW